MYFMQNGRLRDGDAHAACSQFSSERMRRDRHTDHGNPSAHLCRGNDENGVRHTVPPFQLRLQQYLKESKDSPMIYKNDKHRAAFEAAIKKENKKNYALMSALYLLTADGRLWRDTKRFVVTGCICFEQVHLSNWHRNRIRAILRSKRPVSRHKASHCQ